MTHAVLRRRHIQGRIQTDSGRAILIHDQQVHADDFNLQRKKIPSTITIIGICFVLVACMLLYPYLRTDHDPKQTSDFNIPLTHDPKRQNIDEEKEETTRQTDSEKHVPNSKSPPISRPNSNNEELDVEADIGDWKFVVNLKNIDKSTMIFAIKVLGFVVLCSVIIYCLKDKIFNT